jgi:DNA invertase Pin-like site-specific DNA recombinase
MKNLKQFDRFARGKTDEVKRNNTCVIYTRVSTREQAENNMSLDTQRRACERHCKKCNYQIMAYFGGTYESAKTDERVEFNSMLSFVQKSRAKISYIVVYSVDRFSRSGANAIYIAEQLKKNGIGVLSVSQPTDVSTPSGSFQQNIQFIFSEYDNQLRREKSIAGMRDKLLRGEWCVKPPRGYDIITINGKRSIVINKDGELVRKAFLWKFYERISQTEIAERLRNAGLKLKSSSISSLLRNPFYCGILSNKLLEGKVVIGKHKKIISPELFLLVNEQLSNSRRRNALSMIEHPALPFRRFVICNKCNRGMSGYCVIKKGLFYYKCPTTGCRNNKSAIALHQQFIGLLNKTSLDIEGRPSIAKEFASNFVQIDKVTRKSQAHYKGNLTILKGKIESLEERYVLGEVNDKMYQKYLLKLQTEEKQIQAQLVKSRASLKSNEFIKEKQEEIVHNLAGLWEKGDLRTRRLMQAIIFPEGIHYDKQADRISVMKIAPGFAMS